MIKRFLILFQVAILIILIAASCGNDIDDENIYDPKTGLVVKNTNIEDVSYTSVKLASYVMSKDSGDVIRKGFCYDTIPEPTIDKKVISSGNKIGDFTVILEKLKHNTKYYVRAFAENQLGITYGEEASFKTLLATVKVTGITLGDIYSNAVRVSSEVVNEGGLTIYSKGFCYDTSPNPTADNKFVVGSGTANSFSAEISGLSQKTTYYVRAFAEMDEGRQYGEQTSFSTTELKRPQNVNSFTITVNNKKLVTNAVYSTSMKQYLVTYQTYSEVIFTWSSNDSKIAGLVALNRYDSPKDGYQYNGSYKEYSLNPSGTMNFPKWNKPSGYYQLYIWSLDKNYVYSENYYLAQAYIEPTRTYQEWSSSPYGN